MSRKISHKSIEPKISKAILLHICWFLRSRMTLPTHCGAKWPSHELPLCPHQRPTVKFLHALTNWVRFHELRNSSLKNWACKWVYFNFLTKSWDIAWSAQQVSHTELCRNLLQSRWNGGSSLHMQFSEVMLFTKWFTLKKWHWHIWTHTET